MDMETLTSLTTSASIAIAFFALIQVSVALANHYHSKRVARAQYLLSLHDRRMQVFHAIEDMFGEFWQKGSPPLDAAVKLRHAARNAEFIFPDGPLQFIEEIVEKSFEHRRATTTWEPLRERAWHGEELSPEEVKKKQKALYQILNGETH